MSRFDIKYLKIQRLCAEYRYYYKYGFFNVLKSAKKVVKIRENTYFANYFSFIVRKILKVLEYVYSHDTVQESCQSSANAW